ncbi:MAG: hypothetical protein U5K54_00325 [Cytophagales bacterium]|nr:hypothetical protein [Cytophagales bacterium]
MNQGVQYRKILMNQYLDKYLTPESDPFAAMNAAYWQEGLFIHVPENTTVSQA